MRVRRGTLPATWQLPDSAPTGWVWLQHGFARRGQGLQGLATALAASGWAVVRPDVASLRPRRSMHDREHLVRLAAGVRESAEDVTGLAGPGIGIGHSAGAAVMAWVAGRDLGIAGVVLLDPVDTVGGLLADARLTGPTAIAALRPSRCNRGGRTIEDLARRGRPATRFPGLSHADPERIPGTLSPADVRPAGWSVSRVCGTGGAPADVVALGEWTLEAAAGLRPAARPDH